jgi:GrpB-like predicted nucleotidyltransferase (UPF0157 family)
MVRKVKVVPYDPTWPSKYVLEVERLESGLCPAGITFHHIGSTAVPGLAAKPTIDILAVVEDLALLDAVPHKFIDLGYQVKGENGIAGRRYYQKLSGEVHLFHIHAFEKGHPEIERHLTFRDYLCAHPEDAQAYQALKQNLAQEFPFDAKSYTVGKTNLIGEIDRKAALWRKKMS